MKIAFLTRKNPYDKRTWSGCFYSMFSELSQENKVKWVRPGKRSIISKVILTVLSYWHRFTIKKSLNIINNFYAKSTVPSLKNIISTKKFDIVFAAAAPELIAYLELEVPIVYFLDATFIQLSKDYPAYSNLPDWNHRQAMQIEFNALHKSNHIIVSSEWAKNSVVHDYNIDPEKVSIIGLGANMIKIPDINELKLLVAKRIIEKEPIKLLFIGKNWKRKGGEYALNAFVSLNNMDIKTTLTIIGTVPPELPEDYGQLLQIVPSLDKNDEEDFLQLYKHFEDAHFFILPTRGDCTPIVFCEAAAFGLPVITTDTGGVKDVVKDGVSGIVLSMDASGTEYAEAIKNLYLETEHYKKMAYQSRERYDNIINWKTWLNNTMKVLENINGR